MTSRPRAESLAGQDPCEGVPAAAFRGACACRGQGTVGTRPSRGGGPGYFGA